MNHYWVPVNNRLRLSKSATGYRWEVFDVCFDVRNKFSKSDRLSVEIVTHQPNRGVHDLDNLEKAILDSLEHARVFPNDSQIDNLRVMRGEVVKGGRVDVTIERISDGPG